MTKLKAMTMTFGFLGLVVGTGGVFGLGSAHPAYSHALADMTMAKDLIDKASPSEVIDMKELAAIREIDATIRELHKAGIDEKTSRAHSAAVKQARSKRLHEALRLLAQAQKDIKAEKGEPSPGLKTRAEKHLLRAHTIVDGYLRHLG